MPVTLTEDTFGRLEGKNGEVREVRRITLDSPKLKLQVINYGATITSLSVPNVDGSTDDVVLGFHDLPSYVSHTHYFGCTVGRVANRIADGRFVLRDKEYPLAINNGPNHLHGGIKGFDKVIWDCRTADNKVIFSYLSPSEEEGYPGDLKCAVAYELTDQNEVIIRYEAKTTAPTPVNLTNHSYFNLGGHGQGPVYDHVISIHADHYTPVDEHSIPTGDIAPVDSTAFDLRKPKSIESIFSALPNGVDHNFCVNGTPGTERKVASVHHPQSGRLMEVYSTQPGVQLYTANYLPEDNSLLGKGGKYYKKHGAFCLETQNYPDAINHANFPKAFLDVDELYSHTTRFRFSLK